MTDSEGVLTPVTAWLYRHLCRAVAPGDGTDALAQLDPAAVIAAADHHGVVPLLHEWLLARPDPRLAALGREVAVRRRASTKQMLRLTALAGEAAEVLRAAGIDSLVFKGPTVAVDLYGAVDLRHFWDIDLLVAADSVLDADAALRGAGFARIKPRRELAGGRWRLYRDTQHEFGYRHAASGFGLELHWRFADSAAVSPMPFADLLARARRVPIPGPSVALPALSRVDTALCLAIHGAVDGWSRLKWLADLPRLAVWLDAGERDDLATAAGRWRVEGIVALMAGLMELAGVPPGRRPERGRAPGPSARREVFGHLARVERCGANASLSARVAQLRQQARVFRPAQFLHHRYVSMVMPADFDAFATLPAALVPVLPWLAQASKAWSYVAGRQASR